MIDLRKKLRALVCEHQLEWNNELYDDFVRLLSRERQSHIRDMVRKLDLWTNPGGRREVEGPPPEGQAWFAHPIYFMEHLDRAGLLRAEQLRKVQDMVLALECLEPSSRFPKNRIDGGMYRQGGETYCNHAAFLTVIATDKNFVNFTGKEKTAAGDYPFPECPADDATTYTSVGIRTSNYWCDQLEKFVTDGKLVRLSHPDAQRYGNLGFTVVGSYRARTSRGDVSPHFATVRPGWDYHATLGPMVANVGGYNLVGWAGDTKCFDRTRLPYTIWYYNPGQEFEIKTGLIEKLGKDHGWVE
jgi:hypothetical protein